MKHGGFSDQKYQHSADTYGKLVGLTRTHIINDDMGALSGVANMLGMEAAKSQEEMVYQHLLSNKATIFTTARGNRKEGAASDLTISGPIESWLVLKIESKQDICSLTTVFVKVAVVRPLRQNSQTTLM